MVTNYKILVLLAFFLICSKVQESKSENYTKTWSPISNSNSANYGTSMESFSVSASDNKFIYARCSLNNRFSCNIKVVTPIEENSFKESSCDLQLSDKSLLKDTYRIILHLQHFNNNKVIVTSAEEKIDEQITNSDSWAEITITTLDMSSCNASQYIKYKVLRADYENTMVIYPLILNDTIDIFVSNKTVCQPFEKCKISFDYYNRQIRSPELFPISFKGHAHEVGPVGNRSIFIRGYGEQDKIKVLYTLTNYSETIELMAEYVSEGGGYAFRSSKVSNAHDLYTICWEDSRNRKQFARCVQFDYLGRKRFNVTVPLEKFADQMIGVYNLANGDILFFTKLQDSMVEVKKIDADGQIGRPLGLDFSCRQLSGVEIYAAENNDDLDIYLGCANEELKLSFRNVQKKYLNQHSRG